VAFGQAEHLPAERSEASIVGIELINEILDLAVVELDALDLGGQLLAELLVLALVGTDSSPPADIAIRRLCWTLENFL
jgi:hypothetical protein